MYPQHAVYVGALDKKPMSPAQDMAHKLLSEIDGFSVEEKAEILANLRDAFCAQTERTINSLETDVKETDARIQSYRNSIKRTIDSL